MGLERSRTTKSDLSTSAAAAVDEDEDDEDEEDEPELEMNEARRVSRGQGMSSLDVTLEEIGMGKYQYQLL